MGNPTNRVDLFVEGADFYLGSTQQRLKDGWCDFSKLGLQQAGKYLKKSAELGNIWYLNQQVSPRELRSLEESKRQDMFLTTMGSQVTRLIFGRNCKLKTKEEAISSLGKASLAPNAMVISRDLDRQTALLSLLDEKYQPPALDPGATRFRNARLRALRRKTAFPR